MPVVTPPGAAVLIAGSEDTPLTPLLRGHEGSGNGAYLHQEDQQVSLPSARGWSSLGFGVPSSLSHSGSL